MANVEAKGGCTCGRVRYTLLDAPLFVHCCHCTWCQRETGSAFVLNGIIEAHKVRLDKGNTAVIDTPSDSGDGQKITRCPSCQVALWSVYPGAGPRFFFMRIGTLDDTSRFPPDIHIFTESKQSWVILGDDIPVMRGYYDRKVHWPAASLVRREATRAMPAADATGPRHA